MPQPALPIPRTTLVGRERELASVRDLLSRNGLRLVTLTGPGGIGKTRLALAVAEQLGDAFPDGIVFVSLAAIRAPELVPAAIAQAFDVREAGQQSFVDGIASAVGGQRLLLALDNFEQVLDAAPVVNELLDTCPRLTVLVTSRAALHLSGEQLVLVPPLRVPDPERTLPLDQLLQVDAVRLFVERARSARDDFALSDANVAVIGGICARLDGLPLALELAAARVRVLSPQALLAHLEHRLRLLTGGPHDQPARLQTLRDTIDWSYDLLSSDEQRLFRQLAVFVGGWTLEAAEAVCGGGLDVLDGLDVLVDHSLVGQVELPDGPGRFGMLETIREYALELLEASDEAAAIRTRHANAYLALAEAQHPQMVAHEGTGEQYSYLATTRADLGEHEFGAWLARLESEQDNLRAALAWLLDTHADELALRLAVALGGFW
jgi:predicted ATPase